MTRQKDRAREPGRDSTAGFAVDASGAPVPDPTPNVLDLVEAAIKRQDDLRQMEAGSLRREAELRAFYDEKLRIAETSRIDAIRAVDVAAATALAIQTQAAATALAAVVQASAEALRTQVAAAATASTVASAAELDPLKKDISDLRRAQYEQQGKTAQTVEARDVRGETRLDRGAILGGISVLLVLVFGIASILLAQN